MNIKQNYKEVISKTLLEEFALPNIMSVPRLTKISINVSLKEALKDKGVIDKVVDQITIISGQKPKVTRAKKSIANFKLREGDAIGVAVTLRGNRMYDFVQKLCTIVLPRVRDFQGVSDTSFDHKGNYTLGMTEQIVFPEIDYAKIDRARGLQITFVQSGTDAKISRRMLELFGVRFKKD